MKITPDINVLLRLIVNDDAAQGLAALRTLESAAQVAISVHAVCELAWVLRSRYAMPRTEIATAIPGLIAVRHVATDRPAVEAGSALLEAGGDFASGVSAFEGRLVGGETSVSFDRTAVKRLGGQGVRALLVGTEADAR